MSGWTPPPEMASDWVPSGLSDALVAVTMFESFQQKAECWTSKNERPCCRFRAADLELEFENLVGKVM